MISNEGRSIRFRISAKKTVGNSPSFSVTITRYQIIRRSQEKIHRFEWTMSGHLSPLRTTFLLTRNIGSRSAPFSTRLTLRSCALLISWCMAWTLLLLLFIIFCISENLLRLHHLLLVGHWHNVIFIKSLKDDDEFDSNSSSPNQQKTSIEVIEYCYRKQFRNNTVRQSTRHIDFARYDVYRVSYVDAYTDEYSVERATRLTAPGNKKAYQLIGIAACSADTILFLPLGELQ